MLGVTSKRVRGLLGRMQRCVPAVVRVRKDVSMESVAGGLPRLLAWCSVVKLDVSGRGIGAKGVRILAQVLGQCSSLAELDLGSRIQMHRENTMLNLESNGIGDEGATSLAGVLGQCSSLAELNLAGNDIGAEGAGSLAGVLGQCSSLAELHLSGNRIDDHGIAMLRACLQVDTDMLAYQRSLRDLP